MVHALLCFVVIWYWLILCIFFRVILVALGWPYDCPAPVNQCWTVWLNMYCQISNEWYCKHSQKMYTYIYVPLQYGDNFSKVGVHGIWILNNICLHDIWIRTTRTPPAPWLPILVIHIRFQVKTRQSQSYKLKKTAKNTNFEILIRCIKMYKYEMDPTRTEGATERTWDAGRTDGRTEWNQYTPPTTLLCGGYNYRFKSHNWHWNVHDIKGRSKHSKMISAA